MSATDEQMTFWFATCLFLMLAAHFTPAKGVVASRLLPRKFFNAQMSLYEWKSSGRYSKSLGLPLSGCDDGFGFEDILSQEDVKEYRERFSKLAEMFPGAPKRKLKEITEMLPLLLTIETYALRKGVVTMRQALPFVDPSYVITQRSAGLDLLISLMSPSFNLRRRWDDVVEVIGTKRNATEFIRRVPQSLTPRYILALRDHCEAMEELLGLDKDAAVDIVSDWPGVLAVNLPVSINRLRASLCKHDILPANANANANAIHVDNATATPTAGTQTGGGGCTDSQSGRSSRRKSSMKGMSMSSAERALLAKIIRHSPRCLAQDVSRRIQQLGRTFPGWNMRAVVTSNPRVLTQKMEGLRTKYQRIRDALHSLQAYENQSALVDADAISDAADDMINSEPRCLAYDPEQLVLMAKEISDELSPGHGHGRALELLTRAPRLLTCGLAAEAIVRKVKRTRKLFLDAEREQNRSRDDAENVADENDDAEGVGAKSYTSKSGKGAAAETKTTDRPSSSSDASTSPVSSALPASTPVPIAQEEAERIRAKVKDTVAQMGAVSAARLLAMQFSADNDDDGPYAGASSGMMTGDGRAATIASLRGLGKLSEIGGFDDDLGVHIDGVGFSKETDVLCDLYESSDSDVVGAGSAARIAALQAKLRGFPASPSTPVYSEDGTSGFGVRGYTESVPVSDTLTNSMLSDTDEEEIRIARERVAQRMKELGIGVPADTIATPSPSFASGSESGFGNTEGYSNTSDSRRNGYTSASVAVAAFDLESMWAPIASDGTNNGKAEHGSENLRRRQDIIATTSDTQQRQTQTQTSPEPDPDPVGVDLTRIVLGNLDLFLTKFPFFLKKVGAWIDEYGPLLAYSVLNAVPATLSKTTKPQSLRPVLKSLYSLASLRCSFLLTTRSASGGSTGTSSVSGTSVLFGRPLSLTNIMPVNSDVNGDGVGSGSTSYSVLSEMLTEAPALLRKQPAFIDRQLELLEALLREILGDFESNSDIDTHDHAALGNGPPKFASVDIPAVAAGAPRLLTESRFKRVKLRGKLLRAFADGLSDSRALESNARGFKPRAVTTSPAVQWLRGLLRSNPRVLTAPSSTLARLFFVREHIAKVKSACGVDLGDLLSAPGELLECSTEGFIALLDSEMNLASLPSWASAGQSKVSTVTATATEPYSRFLSSVIRHVQREKREGVNRIQVKESADDESGIARQDCDDGESSDIREEALGAAELERALCGMMNDAVDEIEDGEVDSSAEDSAYIALIGALHDASYV